MILSDMIQKTYEKVLENPAENSVVLRREIQYYMKRVKKGQLYDIRDGVFFYAETPYFEQDDIVVRLQSHAMNRNLFGGDKFANHPVYQKFLADNDDKVASKKPVIFHRHDFFEMFYVFKGETLSCAGDYETIFREGDLCLYNLNAIHYQDPIKDGIIFNIMIRKKLIDRTFCMFLSDHDLFTGFFINSLKYPTDKNCMIVQQIQDSFLEMYIQNLIVEFFGENDQRQLRNLLCCILNEVSRRYQKQTVQNSFDVQRNISVVSVINYLKSHVSDTTLKKTADYFHYSQGSMIAYFQKHLNASFSQIIQDIKLKKAQKLLLDFRLPLNSIAQKVGYNRQYLDMLFKKNLGKTMAQIRKSN